MSQCCKYSVNNSTDVLHPMVNCIIKYISRPISNCMITFKGNKDELSSIIQPFPDSCKKQIETWINNESKSIDKYIKSNYTTKKPDSLTIHLTGNQATSMITHIPTLLSKLHQSLTPKNNSVDNDYEFNSIDLFFGVFMVTYPKILRMFSIAFKTDFDPTKVNDILNEIEWLGRYIFLIFIELQPMAVKFYYIQ